MAINDVVDYTENTFFHSFSQNSFPTRIARWIKAFTYSFIALLIFSMILEELQNYCTTPPTLFLQFLFLLIMSGVIEFISMQMSNVTDRCVVDYAKNLITSVQQRFFLKKISVLALFDQVCIIGVSAAAQNFFSSFFTKANNCYGIVIMNHQNQLFKITEFEFSLEDANNLAQDLVSRHMPSAILLHGEPDTELVVDSQNGNLIPRPITKNLLTLVDTTILPTLQSFCGLMFSVILIAVSMLVLSKIATHVFDTNLMVAYQPVNQLFVRPVPMPTAPNVADNIPAGVAEIASATTDPNASINQQVVAAVASASESVTVTESDTASNSTIAQIITPDDVLGEQQASETVLYQADDAPTPTDYVVDGLNTPAELLDPVATVSQPEPGSDSAILPTDSTENEISNSPAANKTLPDKVVSSPRPFPGVPPPPFIEEVRPKQPEVQPQKLSQPEVAEKVNISDAPSLAFAHTSPTRNLSSGKSEAQKIDYSILAGQGLHPLIELGDQESAALKKLGKPIAEQVAGRSKQYVFSGFSFASDALTGVVNQITVTRKSVKKEDCHTPQNFAVGTSLSMIKNKLGPPAIIAGQPGLHFPKLGISFIPSPHQPDSVGAIKVYPAGSRPE